MIIYMPDPLELFKEIKTPERITMNLPSGGHVTLEIIDMKQARVVGIISTDPMDYLNSQLQPGSVVEIGFHV